MPKVVFNPLTGEFDFVSSFLTELDDVDPTVVPTKGSFLTGDGTVFAEFGVGADGFILIADSSQALGVRWAAAAPGSGDVVGPGSSTDHALVRWDGATGKLIQDSGAILDDSGNLTLPGTLNGVYHYASAATDPTVPAPSDGDRYWNTAIEEEMRYDGSRSKWLSVATLPVQGGRRGFTLTGSFYRAIDGLTFNAANRGVRVPKGTLTYLSISKEDTGTATLEVLVGGGVIATLVAAGAGPVASTTVNADFNAGNMAFRNQAGGARTQNVSILAAFKRRP